MQLAFVPYFLLFLAVTMPTGLAGCASMRFQDTSRSEPSPIGRDVGVHRAPLVFTEPETFTDSSTSEAVITLTQALSLALMKNPELAAFSWEVRAREARTLQAVLRPNPEIGLEVEEFAGSGERRGFDAATSTLQLSQLIEIGGKRPKRTLVAALERDLAEWDYEAKRLDVLGETTKAFVEVLAGQEQEKLAAELVRLSQQVLQTVSERVKAGKTSPLEEIRSGVILSDTRIQLEQAKGVLRAARRRLSASWGQTTPAFEKVDGSLETMVPIPSASQVNALIGRNPDVARWAKETEQRRAALKLEKARRIPDVTISGGIQRLNDTDDSAFVIGFSIPIPIFNRNQGNIREAQHKLAKVGEEAGAAELKTGTALAEAYQALAFSHGEATSLREDLLPAAQTVFDAFEEGYREGKFDFLDLLDTQRTFFEARRKYIDSLAAYHKAAADVERLTGEGIVAPGRIKDEPEGGK